MESSVASRSNTEPRTVSHPSLAPGARLGPFEVLGTLGVGGMGVVYEVLEHTTGRHLALKVLPALDPDLLHRFKREFRTAADLDHRNLVRLHDLVAEGGAWAYSMELVRGTSIKQALGRSGAVPGSPQYYARIRQFFAELACGVSAVHAARLLHRDIKPANVLVEHGSDRVVLLDFGLVEARGAADPERKKRVAGTPEYLAPETARGEAPVPASDGYAFGVLLFETLTGLLPLRAPTARDLLRRKIELESPRASALVPGVPLDLDVLTSRLLMRDPRQRPSFAEVHEVLAYGARLPTPSVPPRALAGPTQRLSELSVLGESLARVAQGAPVTVLVEGPPHSGKSALVDAFGDWASAQPDTVVLRARCHPRETLPYKGLDTVVDALTEYLLSMPPDQAASIVPEDIKATVELFPVLSRVHSIRRVSLSASPIPELPGDGPGRAFAALKVLMRRLARVRRLVLILEDLEWGDADSGRLLAELASPPDAPAFLLVGTYRRGHRATPLLSALDGVAFGARRRLLTLT